MNESRNFQIVSPSYTFKVIDINFPYQISDDKYLPFRFSEEHLFSLISQIEKVVGLEEILLIEKYSLVIKVANLIDKDTVANQICNIVEEYVKDNGYVKKVF